jgi:hypothetical protein
MVFPVLIPDLFQFIFCILKANHFGLEHIQNPCIKEKNGLQEVKFDLMFTHNINTSLEKILNFRGRPITNVSLGAFFGGMDPVLNRIRMKIS